MTTHWRACAAGTGLGYRRRHGCFCVDRDPDLADGPGLKAGPVTWLPLTGGWGAETVDGYKLLVIMIGLVR
jgi:hypothetical protein